MDEGPGSKEELSKSTESNKSALLKDFYENTTLHGLRNVFVSDYIVLRLVWLALVFLALGWLIYCGIGSVKRYLSFPNTIDIYDNVGKALPLPAITICSQNFADKNKIFARDNETLFQKYHLNISACAATAEVRGGAPCGHALACAFVVLEVTRGEPISYCTRHYQNAIRKAMKEANVNFDLFEFLYTFGESWKDVFKFCFYGYESNSCHFPDIFKRGIKNDRLCYTLNDVIDERMSFVSDAPGSIGGINLLLKTNPDRNFYPRFVEGFTVYIHQKGAGFGDYEINVPPGKLTSIALQRERIELLEADQGGKCEKRTLKGYRTYTQIDCYDECISNFMQKQCGCRPFLTNVYNDSVTCNSQHTECVRNNSRLTSFTSCKCPLPCEVTHYQTSVSYGAMPRKTTMGVTEIFPFSDYSETDFLSISVFYGSHREVVYKQKRTFGFISLLGEVGGNMGLLLGCSAITIVELVFFLFSLLTSCFFSREKAVVHDNNL